MNDRELEKLKNYLENKKERAAEMLEDDPQNEFWMGVYSAAKGTLFMIKRELKK